MVQNKQNSLKKRKSHSTRAIGALFIIVLLGLGIILAVKYLTPSPTTTKEEDTPTQEDKPVEKPASTNPSSSNNIKHEEPTPEDEDPFHKTPTQYEGEDPNLSEELTGSISYTAANGESLNVLVNIDQLLGSGTCTLTLKSGGSTKTYTANIIANPASSSCEGFNVPLLDLNYTGIWQIHLRFTSGDKTGIVEGEVDLNG